MQLSYLQQKLQSIYELQIDHCINDFLVTTLENTDHRLQACLDARESLLICQEGDDLFLSLYLQEEILENLKFNGTGLHIHDGNINDFCLALEGTSHFVYLIWNAMYDRCVTRLEMELQAEIDKFVILSKYVCRQQVYPVSAGIRGWLFDSVSYRPGLSVNDYQRYRDANTLALKYCRYLDAGNYLRKGLEPVLLRELRKFYRLNLREKLRRINYFH